MFVGFLIQIAMLQSQNTYRLHAIGTAHLLYVAKQLECGLLITSHCADKGNW